MWGVVPVVYYRYIVINWHIDRHLINQDSFNKLIIHDAYIHLIESAIVDSQRHC